MNKKDTGGDLMDAYTDKPPPQEVTNMSISEHERVKNVASSR